MTFLEWLGSFWVWEFFFFALLAGVFFGFYVFYMGDEDSSWHDIAGWGVAVYLTFIMLANLYRFVHGADNVWENVVTGSARWFGFIFTIIATAGILRWFHGVMLRRRLKKEENDR